MKTLAIFFLMSMHLALAGNRCSCRRRKTASPPAGKENPCPTEFWVQRNDSSSCYLFSTVMRFYSQASIFCESQAEGAKLVRIDDSAENDFLKLKAQNTLPLLVTGYWIGLRNFNGVEKWLPDDVNATFTDWYPQEPQSGQSCGALWRSYNWQWADVECSVTNGEGDNDGRPLFAICELD